MEVGRLVLGVSLFVRFSLLEGFGEPRFDNDLNSPPAGEKFFRVAGTALEVFSAPLST